MPANSANLQRPFHKTVYDVNLGKSLQKLWALLAGRRRGGPTEPAHHFAGFRTLGGPRGRGPRRSHGESSPAPVSNVQEAARPQFVDPATDQPIAVPYWDGLAKEEQLDGTGIGRHVETFVADDELARNALSIRAGGGRLAPPSVVI